MKKDITTVNVSEPDYAGKLNNKNLKLTGEITLDVLEDLICYEYDYLDISEAEFGIDFEKWEVCLGWSHSGPVYGNSGYRKVEMLRRFLEQIKAKTIRLPDNVQRRHINSAYYNRNLKQLLVTDSCKLFANQDGKLMNKKKTIEVFPR